MRAACRRGATIASVCLLAALPARVGVAEEELRCNPHLVHCNYAQYFSGRVQWRASIEVSGDPSAGSKTEITATIEKGKATCSGTVDGQAIRGEGLVAVERGAKMEDDPGQPWYWIYVSCPEPDGRVPDIMETMIQTYKQKDTAGFKTLAGEIEEDHPDADPPNGVTGRIALEWSLSRVTP